MTARRRSTRQPTPLPFTPPLIDGVVWGSAGEQKPLECWWPGAIPAASLVKIEGRKSTGKSTLAAAIAACVSGGPPIPDWTGPTNRRVLWLGGEEDWDRVIAPRLTQAGVPDGMYAFMQGRTNRGEVRRLVLPDDITILQDTLRDGDFGLLVLDPHSSLAHPSVDLAIPQQARLYYETLAQILPSTNTVCLCVGHVRKGRGGDAREAGYGSAEVTNVMRSVLRCDEHPHRPGDRVVVSVAYNYGRAMPTRVYRIEGRDGELGRIAWVGVSDIDAETICEGRGPEGERDEWADADLLLCSAIGSGWMSYSDIEAEGRLAGVGIKTLRRAGARLKVTHKRIQTGGTAHWDWGPPAGGWPPELIAAIALQGGGAQSVSTLSTLPPKVEEIPTKPRRIRRVPKVDSPPAPPQGGHANGEVGHD